MKLILQAVKALLRKTEKSVLPTISTLSARVKKVESTVRRVNTMASDALNSASYANTMASNALNSIDEVRDKAVKAESIAKSAQTIANNNAKTIEAKCPLDIPALEIQVGEHYIATQSGFMFTGIWSSPALLTLRITVPYTGGISFLNANLTTTSSYDAIGIVDWKDDEDDTRIFIVQVGNKATTSYVRLIRLA